MVTSWIPSPPAVEASVARSGIGAMFAASSSSRSRRGAVVPSGRPDGSPVRARRWAAARKAARSISSSWARKTGASRVWSLAFATR